ncbi:MULTISPECIES: SRPBCC family protein [Streptomyces]|uniref:SRPBCC family protein n=1 Tax=Streptomyces TaxID=1883 RepID=UPI001EFAEBE8|nr:SRPBCC family protein [Streptomyces sp. CL12-4]MCG8969379.1 SRPBCC family protein [Streptomyces sp. CL12-4]
MSPNGKGNGASSPLGDVKDALGGYLSAAGHSLAGKAGERVGGLTDRLTDSAGGGGGSGGRGKGRRGAQGGSIKATHIMETVDIGVPLRTVYDQWTQLQDFSSFTKGVRSVTPSDEVTSDWNVKVGPSSRSWKATVQEQVPDERIVWTSEGAKGSTRGAVSFHELAPRLTRVVVVVEYYPAGFFEKTGNLWRAQGRRLRLDLKHFARHVTLMDDQEVEGWRGEIRDGEVVKSHEEALEEENADDHQEGDEDAEEAEAEDGAEDEDEEGENGAEEEDEEGEYDDEDEADEDEYDDDERARPYR